MSEGSPAVNPAWDLQEWVQRYKEDRTRATAELLTFLIQARRLYVLVGQSGT